MGRPAASASAGTAQRLLGAAAAHFAARGFRGARLADIARDAGIRRPSLLYHYPSKKALYHAVVEHSFAGLRRALEASMRGSRDFLAALPAVARSFSSFLERQPLVAPILLRELLDGHGPGRDILMRSIVPLLDAVERFVRAEGGARLRAGLPVRSAIAHTAAGVLLRGAAGELRRPLWGGGDHTETLVLLTFLRSPGRRTRP